MPPLNAIIVTMETRTEDQQRNLLTIERLKEIIQQLYVKEAKIDPTTMQKVFIRMWGLRGTERGDVDTFEFQYKNEHGNFTWELPLHMLVLEASQFSDFPQGTWENGSLRKWDLTYVMGDMPLDVVKAMTTFVFEHVVYHVPLTTDTQITVAVECLERYETFHRLLEFFDLEYPSIHAWMTSVKYIFGTDLMRQ